MDHGKAKRDARLPQPPYELVVIPVAERRGKAEAARLKAAFDMPDDAGLWHLTITQPPPEDDDPNGPYAVGHHADYVLTALALKVPWTEAPHAIPPWPNARLYNRDGPPGDCWQLWHQVVQRRGSSIITLLEWRPPFFSTPGERWTITGGPDHPTRESWDEVQRAFEMIDFIRKHGPGGRPRLEERRNSLEMKQARQAQKLRRQGMSWKDIADRLRMVVYDDLIDDRIENTKARKAAAARIRYRVKRLESLENES